MISIGTRSSSPIRVMMTSVMVLLASPATTLGSELVVGRGAPEAESPEAAGSSEADESSQALLARARKAVGFRADAVTERVLHAERWIGDERTPFRLTFDREGRFRQEPEVPTDDPVTARFEDEFPGARIGYDGEVAWLGDSSGARLRLPEGASLPAMVSVWSQTLFWLSPSAPLTFSERATAVDGGYVIPFEMGEGRLSGEVEIGDGIPLPRAIRWTVGSRVTEHRITGYRSADGEKLPRRILVRRAGEPNGEFRSVSTDVTPLFLGNPYEPGASPFARAEFNRNLEPDAIAKRLDSGHLLVKVDISDRDMGWFLFDSGSSTDILDKRVAARLGLEPYGEATIQGLAGSQEAHFVRAPTMRVGPVHLRETEFSVIDLRFLQRAFGRKIAGLVGYDLLCRAVVEVDVSAPAIRLYDPGRYDSPREVEWIPISLTGRHATTVARVEGHEARCIVDTGSDAAVALRKEFTDSVSLLSGRKTRRTQIKGATSRLPVTMFELDWLAIGPQRMEGPLALVFEEPDGRRMTDYSDGILGGPLFEGWTLILDYPHRRIAITPAR